MSTNEKTKQAPDSEETEPSSGTKKSEFTSLEPPPSGGSGPSGNK